MDELEDVECLEGDTVLFRCRICPGEFSGVKWYLDETLLYTNDLNEILVGLGGYHTLTFKQLARKDSGTISFEAGDKRSYASLLVRGNLSHSVCIKTSKHTTVLQLLIQTMYPLNVFEV